MDKQRYQVICDRCGNSRLVELQTTSLGTFIDWLEDRQPGPATIISFRPRLDGEWGWQCACGANSLMTPQEQRTFSNPASPKPQEIDEIVRNLKPAKVEKIPGGKVVDKFKVVNR